MCSPFMLERKQEYLAHIRRMSIEKERQRSLEAYQRIVGLGYTTDSEIVEKFYQGVVPDITLLLGGVRFARSQTGAYDWKVLLHQQGGVQCKVDVSGHTVVVDVILANNNLYEIRVYEGGFHYSNIVSDILFIKRGDVNTCFYRALMRLEAKYTS